MKPSGEILLRTTKAGTHASARSADPLNRVSSGSSPGVPDYAVSMRWQRRTQKNALTVLMSLAAVWGATSQDDRISRTSSGVHWSTIT
jgi:hypothetical protein